MNSAVRLWCVKRIKRKTSLVGCFFLMLLVTAPLVVTLVFSESMMDGITSKYICLSDGHLTVDSVVDQDCIKDCSFIYSCDSVVKGSALIYSSSETASCLIKGVDKAYFNEKRSNQITFIRNEGKIKEGEKLNGISISKYNAKKLGVNIGDHVALMIVPDSAESNTRPVLFYVDSIFYSGYDQLDKTISFISRDVAEKIFTSPFSSYTEIIVRPEYAEKLDYISDNIFSDYLVNKWTDYNVSVYENFETSRQMIMILILIIVFVASYFTASIAVQIIQDDIIDIAVMKLIGASERIVRNWAFCTIFTVTLCGILSGCILGIIISVNLSPLLNLLSSFGIPSFSFYLLSFDVKLPYLLIAFTIFCLVLISSLSIRISLKRTKTITPMRLFNER